MSPVDPRRSRLLGRSPLSHSRRRFLQFSSAALASSLLANCARNIATAPDANSSPAASPEAGSGSAAAGKELSIYSWSTYVPQEVLQIFEKDTGIKLTADVYDSNETMLAKMQAGGGNQYGVLFPSDYMVAEMIGLDLLTELDKSRLPSLEALYPQWQNPPYDPGNKFSIPLTWGTTGLVYNAKELGEIKDWDFLWDNKSKLSRKITFLNDVREVMGMALKMLGYSNSTKNPKEIEAAYKKLRELKPAISAFITDGWREQILSGDVLVSHAYSVDAIDVMAQNPDLKYVIGTSGATVWTDTMVIPKSAPDVETAYAYLNYMMEPETAAKIMGTIGLASPNTETKKLLPAKVKEDPNIFPADSVLEKCEPMSPLEEATEIYDKYWTQLTSS